jgi:uncharacterized protein (TIGR02453 family)
VFTGFTEQTQDFLWGIRMNNDRAWFMAHKQDYTNHLLTPMNELAKDVFDGFSQKHPKLGVEMHVSRIYRDARRLHGKGPYKDHLWLSLRAPKPDRWALRPEFWFGLEPDSYIYGMGMYDAKPIMMERFRRELDENPKPLLTLTKKLLKRTDLVIGGAEYKRPKGTAPAPLDLWYNRKAPDIQCFRPVWDETLMSEALAPALVEAFDFLTPFYEYFYDLCIRSEMEL